MSSDAMSTATSSGAMLRVSTNAQGPYESPGLQPGGYELRVTAPGFGTSAQPLQLSPSPDAVHEFKSTGS